MIRRIKEFKTKLEKYVISKRRCRFWIKQMKQWADDKYVLTKSQKNEIRDYYKEYFKANMIFSEFYTQKTGKFYKNYIPDNIYYTVIEPYFNDWHAAKIMDNKCFYDLWYFKDENMPKTIVKRMNGMWALPKENGTEYISKEKALELISENDCFIKQSVESYGGLGVRKVEKGTSIEEINKILSYMGKEIIVQEAIEQSSKMSVLNPHSVNTIRFLSLLNTDGAVKIYSAIARMGINNAVVDNASSGGITCGIEPDGRLKPVAYSANGKRHYATPPGLKFDEVVIPNYDKAIALVSRLHKNFPHFRLLSWDIAIDKNDEPILIEVNLHYGELDFHQLNNGPVFGEDTIKILDEVFKKK